LYKVLPSSQTENVREIIEKAIEKGRDSVLWATRLLAGLYVRREIWAGQDLNFFSAYKWHTVFLGLPIPACTTSPHAHSTLLKVKHYQHGRLNNKIKYRTSCKIASLSPFSDYCCQVVNLIRGNNLKTESVHF
jgi:hypothetical protein